MTCIAMQPLITSCCYEGMRMLHAVRPAQLRRPRDGAAGIRAAPEGRRFKEAAAASYAEAVFTVQLGRVFLHCERLLVHFCRGRITPVCC